MRLYGCTGQSPWERAWPAAAKYKRRLYDDSAAVGKCANSAPYAWNLALTFSYLVYVLRYCVCMCTARFLPTRTPVYRRIVICHSVPSVRLWRLCVTLRVGRASMACWISQYIAAFASLGRFWCGMRLFTELNKLSQLRKFLKFVAICRHNLRTCLL